MTDTNPKAILLEDGDLVIGATIYTPDITRHFVVDDSFGSKMLYDENGGFYIQNDQVIIKTIRKPRKGGQEARDIVAMLAKKHLAESRALTRQLKRAHDSYMADYLSYDDVRDEIEESKDELFLMIKKQKEYIKNSYKNRRLCAYFVLYNKAKSMLI